MKFTVNGKELGKQINLWAKSKSAVVNGLHTLAVGVICHAIEHGDVSLVNRLDEAARDGTDIKGKTASGLHLSGLREYFVDKGPLTWNRADKKTGKPEHFSLNKAKREELLSLYTANPEAFSQELLGTPFWKLKSQKEFEGFDLLKTLKAALKRAETIKDEDGKKDHPKNNFVGLDDLRSLVARLTGNRPVNTDLAQAA
jgi:hypothetical protein